jgi:hypothetical protein
MASFGSLATSAIGHVQQHAALTERASGLAQKQAAFQAGTAPKSVTADSLAKENRNLSNAQFKHKVDVARTASEAAQGAASANGPSLGDPAWTPPSAIGPGLYG